MNHSTGVKREHDRFQAVIDILETVGIKYEVVHDTIMIHKSDNTGFKNATFALMYGASAETVKRLSERQS